MNVTDELKTRHEESRRREEQRISLFCSMIQRILQRSRQTEDPMTRCLLFHDKLMMILDVVETAIIADSLHYTEQPDSKVADKVTETINTVRAEFEFMSSWITQPIYSPDHPYGKTLMKSAQQHFES